MATEKRHHRGNAGNQPLRGGQAVSTTPARSRLTPGEDRDIAEDKTGKYVKIYADKLGWHHNPLQPDAEDCQEDHYFSGLRLPPVGTSLKEIIAYLSGRDVYKGDDWSARFKFIEAYLDFLEEVPPKDGDDTPAGDRHVDDAGRLLPLPPPPTTYQPPMYGRNTHALVREARRLLRVQKLFEAHQYEPAKQATVLHSPTALPVIRPRQLRLSSLLPGVGMDLKDDDGGAATTGAQQHTPAERAVAAAEVGGQNLAYQENAEFYKSAYNLRGWVACSRDGSSATVPLVRRLPDGTVLGQDAASYARERGARRAAMELASTQFSSTENAAANKGSPWRRVALPIPARNTYERIATAGSRWPWATATDIGAGTGRSASAAFAPAPAPWKVVMDESRKDADDENKLPVVSQQTHPYTAYMAEYRHYRLRWMEKARTVAESQNKDNPDWAMLPRLPDAYCLGYSRSEGPSRRSLPRPMEQDRRMLVLLRSIARLLERALGVAPRTLLRDVRKYATQGLRGLGGPDEALKLRDTYDWHAKTLAGSAARKRVRVVRPISEVEARWLKFLLTGSTNSRMVLPLPEGADLHEAHEKASGDEQEKEEHGNGRDGQALYQCFSQRLQGLMDDLSDTRLFQTVDTEVTIKELVDTLNGDRDSPATNKNGWQRAAVPLDATGGEQQQQQQQQRVRFSYGDGRFFCDRLSRASRCRFSAYKHGSGAGNRNGGIVQRPRLSLHPEHRIWAEDNAPPGSQEGPSWLARQPLQADEHDVDVAIGAPRRALEVDDSWAKTLASGRAKKPLRTEVHDFFCALAFRFGRTLRQLEMVERGRWEDVAWEPADSDSYASGAEPVMNSMSAWQHEYENLTSNNEASCDLIDIVRGADPAAVDGGGSMAAEEARRIVGENLLVEAERALTPLPTATASRPTGALWDWALPPVCGTAPQFFSIDRWPLHLQTPAAAQYWARQNTVLDPEAVWDPASEDPAPAQYMWRPSSSATAFGFQRERRQAGPVAFLHGETKLQRQMVIDDITDRVATALAAAEESGTEGGIGDRLTARVPFLRWRRAADSAQPTFDDVVVEEAPLPELAGSSIPHSVEWKAQKRAEGH